MLLAAVDADDAIVGRILGNYRVERKLGEGGMGAVYLLVHNRLPSTFAALKVLTSAVSDGTRAHARFQQEAMVAAAVGSHRVVKPLDVGAFDDGVPYILMEYVEGQSLAAMLRAGGPLPVLQAVKVAYRIADTMALAHQKGIVHRDLKPSNIMLAVEGTKEDVVKVLDFGVARASGSLKVAHTGESAIIGTPGYMSPEALAGFEVDGKADVFSLGVVLFEMLTGELPFPAPNSLAGLVNALTMEAPRALEERPAHLDRVPPAVEEVLLKALIKEPNERPTMAQVKMLLLSALERIDGGPQTNISSARESSTSGASAPATPGRARIAEMIADLSSTPHPRPDRRRWPLLAGTAVVLLAVGLAAGRARWKPLPPAPALVTPAPVAIPVPSVSPATVAGPAAPAPQATAIARPEVQPALPAVPAGAGARAAVAPVAAVPVAPIARSRHRNRPPPPVKAEPVEAAPSVQPPLMTPPPGFKAPKL